MAARRKPFYDLLLYSVLLMAAFTCFAEAQTPTFFARTDYFDGGAYAMVLADFNGDGILDIAYLDGGQPVVWIGKGGGTFSPGPAITGFGPSEECIATGDFNGDGKTDIVVGGVSGTIQVGYGNGDGTFQPGPLINIGVVPVTLTVGDVNGDGLPDILVGTYGLLVFLNQGAGVFGPFTTFFPAPTLTPQQLVTSTGMGSRTSLPVPVQVPRYCSEREGVASKMARRFHCRPRRDLWSWPT